MPGTALQTPADPPVASLRPRARLTAADAPTPRPLRALPAGAASPVAERPLSNAFARPTTSRGGYAALEPAPRSRLTRVACAAAGQLADSVSEAVRGADIVRRKLAKLAGVAQGLAKQCDLTATGDGRSGGHGCSDTTRGLALWQARLAGGAAAKFATTLFNARMTTPLPSPDAQP